jgi:glycerate-2-kinase
MSRRLIAEQIFREGIDKVLPERLIPGIIYVNNNNLRIGDLYISLETIRNIYVIGAGKASCLMGAEVEKILGDKIKEGHIAVKYGHSCKLKHITVSEAGHPVPDATT